MMTRFAWITLGLLAGASAMIQPAMAQDAEAGEKTFRQRCTACHTLDGTNRMGPSLQGVIGRAAGSVEDFRYSPAMAESDITWDEPTLVEYLANPRDLVPGTKMVLRLPKEEDRANVAAYLATQ